jgi:hypothetical protein
MAVVVPSATKAQTVERGLSVHYVESPRWPLFTSICRFLTILCRSGAKFRLGTLSGFADSGILAGLNPACFYRLLAA